MKILGKDSKDLEVVQTAERFVTKILIIVFHSPLAAEPPQKWGGGVIPKRGHFCDLILEN